MTDHPTTLTLTLPWPPSKNRLHRTIIRGKFPTVILSKAARDYFAKVRAQLAGVAGFGPARLSLEIYLYPPTRRGFDLDGRCVGLLDALENAGIFDNDNQVDRLIVERCEIHKGGMALVQLEEIS
jgi:crossover junction endodeoxyribonuclease RusA